MAYIDKEKAQMFLRTDCLKRYPASFANGLLVAAEQLNKIPTADVVEVVRCKNCEYLLKDLSERQAHLCMRNPFCRINVKLDDFCSYGERKEGE